MHKRPHGRNTLVEGDPLIGGDRKGKTSGCLGADRRVGAGSQDQGAAGFV